MLTVTLWQRSPVAQSPSPAQYFRQTTPASAAERQPVPRGHGVVDEQGLPGAPPSVFWMQASTAPLPAHVKSHFATFDEQFCAAGSQVVTPPVPPAPPMPPPPPPGAPSGGAPLVELHAPITTAIAAATSVAALSRFTATTISR